MTSTDSTSEALALQTPTSTENNDFKNNMPTGELGHNGGTRYTSGKKGTTFEGDTPKIGAVIGLKSEKISAKVQFDTFREKEGDFVLQDMTNSMDIVAYVRDLEDLMEDFVRRFLPRDFTDSERDSHFKKGVFDQKLKKYVDREYQMYGNKVKLYTYIWGQCSNSVK